MHNSILYSRSTAIPYIRGHFHRPRIDKLLAEALDGQLIVVTAGAGWGKTHAVSSFLSNVAARVFWLQLSELDNHVSRFWEEFIYIIAFHNNETAALLEQLGFPETLSKFDQFLHILAKEIYAGDQVVFVFDDFHLIKDEAILHFINQLIVAKLENTRIIINSRTNVNFIGIRDLVCRVTTDDLRFTPDETEGYLKQNNINLTDRELKEVHDYTEGWPLALFLVSLSVKNGGMVSDDPIAGAIPLIFDMIERELFSEYPPQVQNFLVRVSLLSVFPEGLLNVVAGDHLVDIMAFIDSNMFIYKNPYTNYYYCHHLFLEFLKGKQEYLTKQEINDLYLTAGDWCAANDLELDAFSYYDKCGQYQKITDIMLDFKPAIYSKSVCEFYISLIDKFPEELVKKNPMIHVNRAGLLLNNNEIEHAVQELLQTQKELESLPPTEENKTVLGYILCMRGLLSLGSCSYDFVELFKKASEYLPNGGMLNSDSVVNTKYAIMLNSPAAGALKKMEDALFTAIPYASIAMHGFAQGMDYLAAAEAAFFCGDMKKAEKNAYEALYRAREKPVRDIATNAYFLLMRIEAANGNYEGVVSQLEQLKAFAESVVDKWNFNAMPDVAQGWFNVLIGSSEKVADWIVDDTDNVLAPYSTGMERMVKARCMLRDRKYYELLAWLRQSDEMLRQNNMLLVLLDNMIYKSIALHHVHDEEQTVAALREAYDIAHGNNLLMQFAELGNEMRALVYAAKHSEYNTIPDDWLDRINTKASTYEKRMNNLRSQHEQALGLTSKPSIKLTEKEKEIIKSLCQGLTNTEIANSRYISLSAVKKTLNNIYIKLGATNRADAVKVAVQMELHN